ncbi:hypothetical protein EASAB2608_00792 [Streptomyces sp. EAS-AB2608]|uniref:Uncharacterized protein n=1 Tax=Streptomyces bangladeshensis TaxID=295352 RepID=A0ABN3BE32_9ACTN|nr:hypothetical protein EASAB2608_00792 [Streptomyces sp. EAS-AB2608]
MPEVQAASAPRLPAAAPAVSTRLREIPLIFSPIPWSWPLTGLVAVRSTGFDDRMPGKDRGRRRLLPSCDSCGAVMTNPAAAGAVAAGFARRGRRVRVRCRG